MHGGTGSNNNNNHCMMMQPAGLTFLPQKGHKQGGLRLPRSRNLNSFEVIMPPSHHGCSIKRHGNSVEAGGK